MPHDQELIQAIRDTLAFFSIFGKRLTKEELIQYLYLHEPSEACVTFLLEDLSRAEHTLVALLDKIHDVDTHGGTYGLKTVSYPDQALLQEASSLYTKKCTDYLPTLSYMPFVRSVMVANTVAFAAATKDSDIDLFIIMKSGKLWMGRLVTTLFLHILGIRRHGAQIAGRFCLSFFVDTHALNLSSIALPEGDIYLRFWLVTLEPIFGYDHYTALLKANTTLLGKHFPLWRIEHRCTFLPTREEKISQFQHLQEILWDYPPFLWLAQVLTYLQKKKMETFPTKQTELSSIVVDDHMLKFHNNDRRKAYRNLWVERRKKIDLSPVS